MRVEFPIYRVISEKNIFRGRLGVVSEIEIAVLRIKNVGGQAVMCSVNRHIHHEGGKWIGRHPDYYDGVDTKNIRAEEMFNGLDAELVSLTRKLEALDEEIAQWVEQRKFYEMAVETAKECAESLFNLSPESVLVLLDRIRLFVVWRIKDKMSAIRAEAVNVGVKKEHAKNYLADVRRDFPRMVEYVHQK